MLTTQSSMTGTTAQAAGDMRCGGAVACTEEGQDVVLPQSMKQQKQREKNRRAQRAYRERQRQRRSHLADESQALKDENKALQEQLAVERRKMEAVQRHMEQLENMLNDHKSIAATETSQHGSERSRDGVDVMCSRDGANGMRSVTLQDIETAYLTWTSKTHTRVSEEVIPQMMQFAYSRAAAALLRYEQNSNDVRAVNDLENTLKGARKGWIRLTELAPTKMRETMLELWGRSNSGLSREELHALHRRVASLLQLTSQQLYALTREWHAYKNVNECCNKRRAAIAEKIAADGFDARSAATSYATYIHLQCATEELASICSEENRALASLGVTIYDTLSAYQHMKCMTAAQPLFVEYVQLCSVFAEELYPIDAGPSALTPSARVPITVDCSGIPAVASLYGRSSHHGAPALASRHESSQSLVTTTPPETNFLRGLAHLEGGHVPVLRESNYALKEGWSYTSTATSHLDQGSAPTSCSMDCTQLSADLAPTNAAVALTAPPEEGGGDDAATQFLHKQSDATVLKDAEELFYDGGELALLDSDVPLSPGLEDMLLYDRVDDILFT